MNFPLYIAKRYLIAKSRQNAINIINRITAAVVVIGGAALFIVLAGFAGLKTFSLSFASLVDPDLKILPATGKYINLTQNQWEQIKSLPEVVSYSAVVEERVFLNYKDKNHIAYFKGVDSSYPMVNNVDSILAVGNWDLNEHQVVVGAGILNLLGLTLYNTNSSLQIIVPKAGKGSITSATRPYRDAFVSVSGVYQVTEELDKTYVFGTIKMARYLLDLKSTEYSGVELKLKPGTDPKEIQLKLQTLLGEQVLIKTRIQLNDALHRMLNTENIAVYLIFTLVLIVALFNLVGALIMMILDKKNDAKTLYSLGTSIRNIRRIFFLQGLLVSFFGAAAGLLLGLLITQLQISFGFLMISSSLPYPMEITPTNTVIVFITILVLGAIASWIGSSRISFKLIANK